MMYKERGEGLFKIGGMLGGCFFFFFFFFLFFSNYLIYFIFVNPRV